MTPENLLLGPEPGRPAATDAAGSTAAPEPRPGGWTGPILFLALLAVGSFLRLTALSADPPPTLSPDFLSDETWWAHNARNHALFGHWLVDDFNQGFFAAPLHTLLERISFAIGGVNLKQARLVSALAGSATILFIGLFVRRAIGFRASLIAMGFLATDYFAVSFDRAGFVEPLPSAFMSLSIALMTWPRLGRTGLVLAGVAADLACLSKINSIFFLATPLVWVMIRSRPGRDLRGRLGDLLALMVGIAVPLAIFAVTFVLPNLPEYLSQNGRLRDESKVGGRMVLLNIFTISIQDGKAGLMLSGLATQSLLPTILGMLWLIHALSQAARHGFRKLFHNLTDPERIALLWIGSFMPYFVLQDNGPDRRYYVFIAPLAILGAQLLAVRREERIELHTSDLRARRALIVLSACFIAAAFYLRAPAATALGELFRDIRIGDQPGLSKISLTFLATALIALIALPSLWVLLRKLPRSGINVMLAAVIIALVGETLQVSRLVATAASLTYTLDRTGRDFATRLGPDARVINGQPLVMATKCRNLIMLDRRPVGHPYYGMNCLEEFRPTHLLTSSFVPLDQAGFDQQLRDTLGDRYRSVPSTLESFQFWPDADGKLRAHVTLGRIVAATDHDAAR